MSEEKHDGYRAMKRLKYKKKRNKSSWNARQSTSAIRWTYKTKNY